MRCDQFVGNSRKKSRSQCSSPARFWVYNDVSGEEVYLFEQTYSCEYHLFQAVTRFPGSFKCVEEL